MVLSDWTRVKQLFVVAFILGPPPECCKRFGQTFLCLCPYGFLDLELSPPTHSPDRSMQFLSIAGSPVIGSRPALPLPDHPPQALL